MTPFEWAGYLTIARSLRREIGGEAAERSAVSRAYYACFHVASIFALARGYTYDPGVRGGKHQQVWAWFIATGRLHRDPTYGSVGQTGLRLHDRRVRADYRPDFPRAAAEADLSILEAQALLDRIAALTPASDGSTVAGSSSPDGLGHP